MLFHLCMWEWKCEIILNWKLLILPSCGYRHTALCTRRRFVWRHSLEYVISSHQFADDKIIIQWMPCGSLESTTHLWCSIFLHINLHHWRTNTGNTCTPWNNTWPVFSFHVGLHHVGDDTLLNYERDCILTAPVTPDPENISSSAITLCTRTNILLAWISHHNIHRIHYHKTSPGVQTSDDIQFYNWN